jgi:hypothetical protein
MSVAVLPESQASTNKVALRWNWAKLRSARQLGGKPVSCLTQLPDPSADVLHVVERSHRCGNGYHVYVESMAHAIGIGDQFGASQQVPEAQPCQSKGLAEGAHYDQVGPLSDPMSHRGALIGQLNVGFVHDRDHDRVQQSFDITGWHHLARRVVRPRQEHELGVRRDGRQDVVGYSVVVLPPMANQTLGPNSLARIVYAE